MCLNPCPDAFFVFFFLMDLPSLFFFHSSAPEFFPFRIVLLELIFDFYIFFSDLLMSMRDSLFRAWLYFSLVVMPNAAFSLIRIGILDPTSLVRPPPFS